MCGSNSNSKWVYFKNNFFCFARAAKILKNYIFQKHVLGIIYIYRIICTEREKKNYYILLCALLSVRCTRGTELNACTKHCSTGRSRKRIRITCARSKIMLWPEDVTFERIFLPPEMTLSPLQLNSDGGKSHGERSQRNRKRACQ